MDITVSVGPLLPKPSFSVGLITAELLAADGALLTVARLYIELSLTQIPSPDVK